MNPDAEYIEVTYGMESNYPDHIPTRYRMQIKKWECKHCDFVLTPERGMGNFGRVSHGRAEMRKHVREKHSAELMVWRP